MEVGRVNGAFGGIKTQGSQGCSVAEWQGLFFNMFSTNPNWRLYLNFDNIKTVERIMDSTRFSSTDVVPKEDLQATLSRIYHRGANRVIGLFDLDISAIPGSKIAPGLPLKRIISLLVIREVTAFGLSSHYDVAKRISPFTDEEFQRLFPPNEPFLRTLPWYKKPYDFELLVLWYIREKYYDAETFSLTADAKKNILEGGKKSKYHNLFIPAIRELEFLLGNLPPKPLTAWD